MKNKPHPSGGYAAFVHVSGSAKPDQRSAAPQSSRIAEWRSQAENGDPRARLALACLAGFLMRGAAVPKDLKRAVELLLPGACCCSSSL